MCIVFMYGEDALKVCVYIYIYIYNFKPCMKYVLGSIGAKRG